MRLLATMINFCKSVVRRESKKNPDNWSFLIALATFVKRAKIETLQRKQDKSQFYTQFKSTFGYVFYSQAEQVQRGTIIWFSDVIQFTKSKHNDHGHLLNEFRKVMVRTPYRGGSRISQRRTQTQKWGTDLLFCHFPWKFRENKENSTRGAHWIFYYVDPPLPFQLLHSGSAIVQEGCQGLEILEMNNLDVPCLATISNDNCTTSFCGSLWPGVSLCTKSSRSIFFLP